MYGALRADTMIRQLQCMAPSWPPPVLRVEVGGLCARVASLIACWHEQRQCVCVCTVYGHDMWHRLIELVTVTNLLLSRTCYCHGISAPAELPHPASGGVVCHEQGISWKKTKWEEGTGRAQGGLVAV